MIRALAVFTASRTGDDPALAEAAYAVGRGLAERHIDLVYGGGGSGLMGAVSQGAIDHGGRVTGVIPRFMAAREWARSTDERVVVLHVDTMHERKALMAERADAFLALPGGLGTLEEIFEVWTWRTLGLHRKPLGFYDVGGFWAPLLEMLDQVVGAGLMERRTVDELVVAGDLDKALAELDRRR
ncbi:MAG TPA: TIGR00730 family Rossman fold protein [Nocardioides sp.]|jgi:hypothetical protein